jgi:bifunctional polynucleotide phosphatase/kinase
MAAIDAYLARFEEPSLDEGFVEIVKVDFTFSGTEEEKETWCMWWD